MSGKFTDELATVFVAYARGEIKRVILLMLVESTLCWEALNDVALQNTRLILGRVLDNCALGRGDYRRLVRFVTLVICMFFPVSNVFVCE